MRHGKRICCCPSPSLVIVSPTNDQGSLVICSPMRLLLFRDIPTINQGGSPRSKHRRLEAFLVGLKAISMGAVGFGVLGHYLSDSSQQHLSDSTTALGVYQFGSISINRANLGGNRVQHIVNYELCSESKIEGLELTATAVSRVSPNESPSVAIIPGVTNASEINITEIVGGVSAQKISEGYPRPTVMGSSNGRVDYSEGKSKMKGLRFVQGIRERIVIQGEAASIRGSSDGDNILFLMYRRIHHNGRRGGDDRKAAVRDLQGLPGSV
ncbi:hypothetical protein Nepgr_017112 [Nepenthes gracilis]|uniref:Uncharacterized protein n=1 Tax=Nepenthes gracilis TaxID=150966 RepID=A0AAD3XT01_NEPGR|nr:hypothetical protein Nepgr_017112 [Nepenthes gracilis]